MVSNLLKGKTREWIHKVSAILLLVLSIVMVNRGLSILNIHVSPVGNIFSQLDINTLSSETEINFTSDEQYVNYIPSVIEEGVQHVSFHLTYSDYADILLQKGIPVEMNIIVDEDFLTGCNNEVISHDFDFDKRLSVGDNIITFTPNDTGDYTYTCWMNMIENKIKVIDNENYFRK